MTPHPRDTAPMIPRRVRTLARPLVLLLAAALGLPPRPAHADPGAPPPAPPPAPSHPTLHLSGYLQVQYTFQGTATAGGAGPLNTFLIRRARLKAAGEVVPGVGYDVLVEAATPTTPLRDAYLRLRLIPHLEIRVGQQKTPFGYDWPTSSTVLVTLDRSLVSRALGRAVNARDIGISARGHFELPARLGLEYAVALVNGAGPNALDGGDGKDVFGRVGALWRPGGVHLRLGISGAAGDLPGPTAADPARAFQRLGADLELDAPWVALRAEGILGWADTGAALGPTRQGGVYATLFGRSPWHLGPLVRLGAYTANLAGGTSRTRLTAGAYWNLPSPDVRVVANVLLEPWDPGHPPVLEVQGQARF